MAEGARIKDVSGANGYWLKSAGAGTLATVKDGVSQAGGPMNVGITFKAAPASIMIDSTPAIPVSDQVSVSLSNAAWVAVAISAPSSDSYIASLINGSWVNICQGASAGTYAEYLQTLSGGNPGTFDANGIAAWGFDNGQLWVVTNKPGDFVVVPEPGTWAMLVAGGSMLLGWQRMRRKRSS